MAKCYRVSGAQIVVQKGGTIGSDFDLQIEPFQTNLSPLDFYNANKAAPPNKITFRLIRTIGTDDVSLAVIQARDVFSAYRVFLFNVGAPTLSNDGGTDLPVPIANRVNYVGDTNSFDTSGGTILRRLAVPGNGINDDDGVIVPLNLDFGECTGIILRYENGGTTSYEFQTQDGTAIVTDWEQDQILSICAAECD